MSDQLRPARVEEQPAQVGLPERRSGASGTKQHETSASKRRRAGCIIPSLVALVLLIGLAVPFYFLFPLVRDSLRQNSLRDTGVAAAGKIISVSATNTTFNEQPVIRVKLQVTANGRAPYETEVSQAFSMLHAPNLRPGAGVTLKYDPDDPELVVITETGTSPLPPHPALPAAVDLKAADVDAARLEAAQPLCAQVYPCCLIVMGEAGRASCDAFLNPNFPEQGCQTALISFAHSARALGKSCVE